MDSTCSNTYLETRATRTWDDPECKPDTAFETYIENAFHGKVWTFCNRYLSQTAEEERLMKQMMGALTYQPVRVAEGALFDSNNEARGAIIIRSQMGTGKTSILRSLMKVVDRAQEALMRPLRVVCLSSRVSFGHTLMEVLGSNGFQMYNMMQDGSTLWDENRLIISMESVHRLQNPYRNREIAFPDLFIWDEYTSGAIHMKSPTILEKGILLDYITLLAKSGMTQFLYMDAFYDADGLDIIRDMHPPSNIGFLWNVKRPAKAGVINFHFSLDNYDQQIIKKIEGCKERWAREMASAETEERDPVFNDQIVFCFMSKRQLDNKVKDLARQYPNLFAPQYVCRIHSDCDADALRTTLSATTHWPRFIAIFYTSSVLVGTNYDIEKRADVLKAVRLASTTDDELQARKTILDKVCVDIFCNADSQHPCAISLAQMMARTRFAGQGGKIHFFIPPCCGDIERFPTDKARLIEHLDSTRCFMEDALISRDSGNIKATTVVDQNTGRAYITHALQHNSMFVKFYIYAKLCSNRSKISFISHLKQILDGFSETIFNSSVQNLAPLFFLETEAMRKQVQSTNLATKAKRSRDDMDDESYDAAFAKITCRMKNGQLNFTADVMRFYDMNDPIIKRKKTMNDELAYDILRFLMYFGINDLPSATDEPMIRLLKCLIKDVHPWYKNYKDVYETMRVPHDKNIENARRRVAMGSQPDAIASRDVFRSLIIVTSIQRLFPSIVDDTDDGIRLNIPPTMDDVVPLKYETARISDPESIPLIDCCLTAPSVYDNIFGEMRNSPNRFQPDTARRGKMKHIPTILNFALEVAGFDWERTREKIATRHVAGGSLSSNARRSSDNRVTTTAFRMLSRAHDISALYSLKETSESMNLTRSFDRRDDAMFKQQARRALSSRYAPLFMLALVEDPGEPLPDVASLGVIGDVTPVPEMPQPGCTSYYISRNPEHPMTPVTMPFEESYPGVELHDLNPGQSELFSGSPAVNSLDPPTPSTRGAFDRFFRSRR